MSKQYDAIIIGSGTAGQTAAYELNRAGLTVAVVEKSDQPGGTCALRGCQAKKWFYEGMETVAKSRHLSGAGISAPASADWAALRDAKNRFTGKVPEGTVKGLKKKGIEYIEGHARFKDDRTILVGNQVISARFIVIATGAAPMPLPLDGAEYMKTSRDFLELDGLPDRIVFIGGGFIAFEFAHFAARLGPEGIRCTILEAAPRPLGPFDEEMVSLLVEASGEEGIDIHCNVEITAIEKTGQCYRVKTKNGQSFEAGLVVNGAGRAPNISDLELDKAGIEHTRRGITVNEKMQTTNPQVYAVGDCAAAVQLARVADKEAKVATANILHQSQSDTSEAIMDYHIVPAVLFTYPQYGMVGMTETTLKEKKIPYKKGFEKSLSWPTYQRVELRSAAYKLLVDEAGQVLGAHILSDNATGLINVFSLAMLNRISIETLYRQSVMTPYPSRESDIIYMLKPLLE